MGNRIVSNGFGRVRMRLHLLEDWSGYVKNSYVHIDDETIGKYLIENGIAKKPTALKLLKDKMVRNMVCK